MLGQYHEEFCLTAMQELLQETLNGSRRFSRTRLLALGCCTIKLEWVLSSVFMSLGEHGVTACCPFIAQRFFSHGDLDYDHLIYCWEVLCVPLFLLC